MKQNDLLYGLEHQERLKSSIDEVLEDVAECTDNWPVEVFSFRRMDVKRHAELLACHALEHMLETLDEEHSDPDGNPTEPTERMKVAAREFADAVVNDYVSWACEPTGEVIKVEKPKEGE